MAMKQYDARLTRWAEGNPWTLLLSIPRLMLARGIFAMAAGSMVSATRAFP